MNTNQQNIQRDITIDVIKGIAIFLVAFGHGLNNVIDSPRIAEVPASIIWVQKCIYSFHMPLFFFLSGVFAYRSVYKRSFAQVLVDKARRLLVPYFFWSFMVVWIKTLFPEYQNHPETWSDFIYSWKDLHGIHWFLFILFFIYIIYALIAKLCKEEMMAGKMCIILGILLYWGLIYFDKFSSSALLQQICTYMIYFSLGLFGKNFFALIKNTGKFSSCLVLIFFISYITISNRFPFIVSFAGICMCSAIGIRISKKDVIFHRLGVKTMDIYCMHQFFAGAVRILLLYLIGVRFLWMRVIIVTVVGIACSYVTAISKLADTSFYRFIMGYKKETAC